MCRPCESQGPRNTLSPASSHCHRGAAGAEPLGGHAPGHDRKAQLHLRAAGLPVQKPGSRLSDAALPHGTGRPMSLPIYPSCPRPERAALPARPRAPRPRDTRGRRRHFCPKHEAARVVADAVFRWWQPPLRTGRGCARAHLREHRPQADARAPSCALVVRVGTRHPGEGGGGTARPMEALGAFAKGHVSAAFPVIGVARSGPSEYTGPSNTKPPNPTQPRPSPTLTLATPCPDHNDPLLGQTACSA